MKLLRQVLRAGEGWDPVELGGPGALGAAICGPGAGPPGTVVGIGFNDDAMHALLADGTVWSRGSNYFGVLGIPRAGVNEPWAAQNDRVLALRADGTAVSWGKNESGSIGDGVSPLHLTPARVLLPCRLTAVGQREGEPQSCSALP